MIFSIQRLCELFPRFHYSRPWLPPALVNLFHSFCYQVGRYRPTCYSLRRRPNSFPVKEKTTEEQVANCNYCNQTFIQLHFPQRRSIIELQPKGLVEKIRKFSLMQLVRYVYCNKVRIPIGLSMSVGLGLCIMTSQASSHETCHCVDQYLFCVSDSPTTAQ